MHTKIAIIALYWIRKLNPIRHGIVSEMEIVLQNRRNENVSTRFAWLNFQADILHHVCDILFRIYDYSYTKAMKEMGR